VCPYSCKSQTTRKRSRAIYTEDDTQIVFLDTPGVVSLDEVKKFKLEKSLYVDPEISCVEAHLLVVLHDVSNRFVREAIDPKILRLLCKYQHTVPSILVLNKIDILTKKRRIFDLICKLTCNRLDDGRKSSVQINNHEPKWNVESYLKRLKRKAKHEGKGEQTKADIKDKTFQAVFEEAARGRVDDVRAAELTQGLLGWPGFRDVFTISAKNGDGVADLKNYIIKNAKPGGHRFSADIVHDQDPRQTVVDIIKSKLLDNLDREVPFKLQPEIQAWQYDEEKKILNIAVSIETKTSREAKQLIGLNGETIRLLAQQMEASLMDYFDTIVNLKLEAKLAKSEADKLSFEAIRNPASPSKDMYLN